MRQNQSEKAIVTSPSQDYFQMIFEGADLFASMWQPMLKSVGRWQLEVAGLGVKSGQAALSWSHDVTRSWTPMDALAANVRFLEAVTAQYAQSSQRIAASVTRAVETPPLSDVVALPLKRAHDMIVLPDEADAVPRKVA
jgi:hypothetical protein